MTLPFIFDPEKGQTPESIARQREIAAALVARSGTPHNVGEGIAAIGNALAYRKLMARADKGQAAGLASANDAFSALFPGMSGAATGAPDIAAPPTMGAPSAPPSAGAAPTDGSRPFRYSGSINFDIPGFNGPTTDFASGGAGRGSAPYGDWPIQTYQAGGNGVLEGWPVGTTPSGTMADPKYPSAPRDEIMLHAGRSDDIDKVLSAGCLAIPPAEWGNFKTALQEAQKQYGPLVIGIDPTGKATVRRATGNENTVSADKFVAATQGMQATPVVAPGPAATPPATAPVAGPVPPAAVGNLPAAKPPMPSPGVQTVAQGPTVQQIYGVLSNPFATEGQKAVAQALLQKQMQQSDPEYQLKLKMEQAQYDQLLHPPAEYGFVTLPDGTVLRTDKSGGTASPIYQGQPKPQEPFTLNEGDVRFGPDGKQIATNPKPTPVPVRALSPEEKVQFGLKPDAAAYMGPDGVPHVLGGGGVTVNNQGNIPAGYRLRTDPVTGDQTMEPIPGSPADLEAKAATAKAADAKSIADVGANVVVQDVDRVIKAITDNPNLTTGGFAALSQGLPGTPAYDAAQLIQTIKANSAFDKLQAMRNASPTGGALGNVSDTEGRLLAAAIGNLELSQNSQQLTDNLKRVKNIYLDIINGKGNGPPREKLSFEPPDAPKPSPSDVDIDALIKKYAP